MGATVVWFRKNQNLGLLSKRLNLMDLCLEQLCGQCPLFRVLLFECVSEKVIKDINQKPEFMYFATIMWEK